LAYTKKTEKPNAYRQIETDFKSGTLPGTLPVLLCGKESWLTNYYEKKLTKRILGDGYSSLDISVFFATEYSDDEIIAACETYPLTAPVRLVIVRGHPGLSATGGDGGLAEYLAKMPETARLILSAAQVNKTRALYKAFGKCGRVYEFDRLQEDELRTFAAGRFGKLGLTIGAAELSEFTLLTGYLDADGERDLFSVEGDIVRLGTFVKSDGRTEITKSDLGQCMNGTLQANIFAMLDAVSTGNKAEAIRQLENSLALGDNEFRLLSSLTSQFEIMLGCREMQEKNKRLLAAGKPSSAMYTPERMMQVLGQKSRWRMDKLAGYAERIPREKLFDVLHRLYGVEVEILSGNISGRLALTALIAGL